MTAQYRQLRLQLKGDEMNPMRKRMFLGVVVTCFLLVLFAAPHTRAADSLSGMVVVIKIRGGVDYTPSHPQRSSSRERQPGNPNTYI